MKSAPESFFTFEGGLYVHYRFVGKEPVLEYRTGRVAVAFDVSTTRFERFGPPEEVMPWAERRRLELHEEGRHEESRHLVVALLRSDLDIREFNQVEADPSRFIHFLQKAGLV